MSKIISKTSSSPAAREKPALLTRITPPIHVLKNVTPNPGVDVMAAIDRLATDLEAPLKADPYLNQMLLRHANLLSEGEGKDAANEYADIDHHIAMIAVHCLKRQKLRRMAVTACSVCSPDRKWMRITLIVRGRGHEARRFLEIRL